MKTKSHLLALLAVAISSSQLHAGLPPTLKTATAPKVTAAAPRVVVPPKVTVVKAPVVPKIVAAPRVPTAVSIPRTVAVKPLSLPTQPKTTNSTRIHRPDPSAGIAAAGRIGKKPEAPKQILPARLEGGSSGIVLRCGNGIPPGIEQRQQKGQGTPEVDRSTVIVAGLAAAERLGKKPEAPKKTPLSGKKR